MRHRLRAKTETKPSPAALRPAYERHGVRGFYQEFAATYRNPHEAVIQALLPRAIREWNLDLSRVLDLACGSGEVTLVLRELGAGLIEGIDPYTGAAYQARTGKLAEALDFAAIAAGALEGRHYRLIVCSFALHLECKSRLPALAHALRGVGESLLILTPHKRPELRPEWGWTLRGELLQDRLRARCYR